VWQGSLIDPSRGPTITFIKVNIPQLGDPHCGWLSVHDPPPAYLVETLQKLKFCKKLNRILIQNRGGPLSPQVPIHPIVY